MALVTLEVKPLATGTKYIIKVTIASQSGSFLPFWSDTVESQQNKTLCSSVHFFKAALAMSICSTTP
jgi:hypothetical protein